MSAAIGFSCLAFSVGYLLGAWSIDRQWRRAMRRLFPRGGHRART